LLPIHIDAYIMHLGVDELTIHDCPGCKS